MGRPRYPFQQNKKPINSGDDVSQLTNDAGYATSKSDIGLGNVDNTSDVNKPVSTAQQSALDEKASLSGAAFTGNITAENLHQDVNVANWNDFGTDPGIYVLSSTDSATNAPANHYYSGVRVFRTNSPSGAEIIARETAGDTELWFRGISSGTPSRWMRAMTTEGGEFSEPISSPDIRQSGNAPDVTNLDTLSGSMMFGFSSSATGAPTGLGGAYDATGLQIQAAGQTTQLAMVSPSSGNYLLIRIDDGGGYSSWVSIL